MSTLNLTPHKRWPLYGAALLLFPTIFVLGALLGHPPLIPVLQSPAFLLAAIAAAFAGNLWPILTMRMDDGQPRVVHISVRLLPLNIAVVTAASALGALLLGYGFVENFVLR